jgi:Fe2+ or Zn2+ uptake regulation protein
MIYKSLNRCAENGLVRELDPVTPTLASFDANTDAHHRSVDDKTGRIHDISWEKIAYGTSRKSMDSRFTITSCRGGAKPSYGHMVKLE